MKAEKDGDSNGGKKTDTADSKATATASQTDD
jgi:hypothetical protein